MSWGSAIGKGLVIATPVLGLSGMGAYEQLWKPYKEGEKLKQEGALMKAKITEKIPQYILAGLGGAALGGLGGYTLGKYVNGTSDYRRDLPTDFGGKYRNFKRGIMGETGLEGSPQEIDTLTPKNNMLTRMAHTQGYMPVGSKNVRLDIDKALDVSNRGDNLRGRDVLGSIDKDIAFGEVFNKLVDKSAAILMENTGFFDKKALNPRILLPFVTSGAIGTVGGGLVGGIAGGLKTTNQGKGFSEGFIKGAPLGAQVGGLFGLAHGGIRSFARTPYIAASWNEPIAAMHLTSTAGAGLVANNPHPYIKMAAYNSRYPYFDKKALGWKGTLLGTGISAALGGAGIYGMKQYNKENIQPRLDRGRQEMNKGSFWEDNALPLSVAAGALLGGTAGYLGGREAGKRQKDILFDKALEAEAYRRGSYV